MEACNDCLEAAGTEVHGARADIFLPIIKTRVELPSSLTLGAAPT